MIKNVVIAILGVALVLSCSMNTAPKCVCEPYKQNEMVDGCVMQKSGGTWIRTCG
jgi:hypothetical protein